MSDIKQGVTLEIFGEGTSMGPLSDSMKLAKKDAQWTTLGEYLDFLVKKGVSTNVASFVGATTVRLHVLGYENRKPNPEELAQMQNLVRKGNGGRCPGIGNVPDLSPCFFCRHRGTNCFGKGSSSL